MIERLIKVAEYYGITNNKFCKIIGASNSFLTKNRAVGSNFIETILEKFPEISPDWLICGTGPMLRNDIAVEVKEGTETKKEIKPATVQKSAKAAAPEAEGCGVVPIDHNALLNRYKELRGIRTDTDLIGHLGVQAAQFHSWRARGRCNLDIVLPRCAGLDVHFVLFGMPACPPRLAEGDIARLMLSRVEELTVENARLRQLVEQYNRDKKD